MPATAYTPVIITESHAEKTVREILAWLEQDCDLCRLGASVLEEDRPLDGMIQIRQICPQVWR